MIKGDEEMIDDYIEDLLDTVELEMSISESSYLSKLSLPFKIKKYGTPLYQFDKYEVGVSAFHVLKNTKTWNNVDEVEYYEISEETFEGISKLYDELFDKII